MELHKWNLKYIEAVKLQKELRKLITIMPAPSNYNLIAGADVSYVKEDDKCIAACVIYSIAEKKIIEEATAEKNISFPYIPGLLSFREVPVLLDAFNKVKSNYEIAILDGQGFAHPRRFGLASHIGLWLDKPTIGCAKTKLIGRYEMPLDSKGSWSFLYDKNDIIGVVLRTREKSRPLFISIGNKMNLQDAISIILKCSTKFRIPEPIRAAHNIVNQCKRKKDYAKN